MGARNHCALVYMAAIRSQCNHWRNYDNGGYCDFYLDGWGRSKTEKIDDLNKQLF